MDEIIGGGSGAASDPRFPHAPVGWTPALAIESARREGLELGEKFHRQGGIRHLYQLFPGGPVAQGCRIAGLKAPAGATDKGFGSVA